MTQLTFDCTDRSVYRQNTKVDTLALEDERIGEIVFDLLTRRSSFKCETDRDALTADEVKDIMTFCEYVNLTEGPGLLPGFKAD